MFYEELLEIYKTKNNNKCCYQCFENSKAYNDIISEGEIIISFLLNALRWEKHDSGIISILEKIITGNTFATELNDFENIKSAWIDWGKTYYPFRTMQCTICAWRNPLSPLNKEFICAVCERQKEYSKKRIQ